MKLRVVLAAAAAFAVVGGVSLASSDRAPVSELEYVVVEAGDTYYGIVAEQGLSCNGTQLWAANGRAPLDPGTIVFIPPSCQQSPTTTVPPTTTTTTNPTSTTSTTVPETTVPPDTTPHHPGVPVDEDHLMAPAPGFSTSIIVDAGDVQPIRQSDGVGAFRTNCSASHMGFDDPIVFPGRPGASHLHTFYGNTGVDAHSTSDSILSAGNSTCWGGIENRSGYWVPTLIDTSNNRPVTPNVDWIDRVSELQVYYKTGYRGVASSDVQNFPAGLRMVAGDARRTTPRTGSIGESPVYFSCQARNGDSRYGLEFLNCAPDELFVMSILFPQCWDGVNLDSADHKSHMAYGTWGPIAGQNGAGCPSTHPVPLPEITQNYRFRVPPGGMSTWRLSSDVYEGTAGWSLHADWWNGWHEPTFQRVVDNCYADGLDCQMNLLGDGEALNGS